MENQVRWNCMPQDFEESNRWTFVIINTRERELYQRGAIILTNVDSPKGGNNR